MKIKNGFAAISDFPITKEKEPWLLLNLREARQIKKDNTRIDARLIEKDNFQITPVKNYPSIAFQMEEGVNVYGQAFETKAERDKVFNEIQNELFKDMEAK